MNTPDPTITAENEALDRLTEDLQQTTRSDPPGLDDVSTVLTDDLNNILSFCRRALASGAGGEPLLAGWIVEYDDGSASIFFDEEDADMAIDEAPLAATKRPVYSLHQPSEPKPASDHAELVADRWAILRQANTERQLAWANGVDPGLVFHALELGGEAGELLNVVKKIERERNGWRGSRATMADLADELADVIICADKLAGSQGIDLWQAVVAKFNATSEKVGLPHRLADALASAPSGEVGDINELLSMADNWQGAPFVHRLAARIRFLEGEVEADLTWEASALASAGHVRRLAVENARLREALQLFLDEYCEMVNSGDAGYWDPELEDKVVVARAALAPADGEGAK